MAKKVGRSVIKGGLMGGASKALNNKIGKSALKGAEMGAAGGAMKALGNQIKKFRNVSA